MGWKQVQMRTGLAVFTSIIVVLLLLPWADARATTGSPETVDGNPTCGVFTDGGVEFKIDGGSEFTNADTGRYTDGVLIVDLVFFVADQGRAFNWSSNIGVDVVVVKGGPGANVYRYDPIATSGSGLHSPLNLDNGNWYGLSHISFCYTTEQPTTSTTGAIVSTTATVTTSTSISTSTTLAPPIVPTTTVGTTTTKAAVLPTGASTTTTIPAEVLATEVLAEEIPFTGLSSIRLAALAVSLLGAGLTLLAMRRRPEENE